MHTLDIGHKLSPDSGVRIHSRKRFKGKYRCFRKYVVLHCRWYDLDKNAVPEVYILKSISKNIPDFLSKDIEAVKAGKSQWWNESERLLEIIAQAADVGLAAKDAIKYKISGLFLFG